MSGGDIFVMDEDRRTSMESFTGKLRFFGPHRVLQQEVAVTEYSGFNPISRSFEWRDVPAC
jgi:hypothetical protein